MPVSVRGMMDVLLGCGVETPGEALVAGVPFAEVDVVAVLSQNNVTSAICGRKDIPSERNSSCCVIFAGCPAHRPCVGYSALEALVSCCVQILLFRNPVSDIHSSPQNN